MVSSPLLRISIFAGFLLVAAIAFLWTLKRLYQFMHKGTADLKFDHLGQRIWSVLVYWLAQKKVGEPVSYYTPKGVTSKHHFIVFWGFLIITIGTIEFLLHGLIPSFSLAFLGPVYTVLCWIIDLFNFLVLLTIGYAFFRRIVLKPRLIPLSLDATIILSLIALLMLTHFGYHACAQATMMHEYYGPITNLLAKALLGRSPKALAWAAEINHWLHFGVLLFFLNYIPYSKHIHILGSLPNIFFRTLGQKGVMPKLNLEDENEWGVGKIEQFGQKSLLDQYACTECARCSNFCPAYNTNKPLSPMHLIHDLREEMLQRGSLEQKRERLQKKNSTSHSTNESLQKDASLAGQIAAIEQELLSLPKLVGGRIKDETLWACTTCGACQEVCPVFIDHPLKIQQMKTHLVLTEGRIPLELQRTFQNLERNDNPWGLAKEKRMDWAEGLQVPTIENNPNPEYLLFVGCAGAFDDRIKKSMRALVEVLQAAEVSFAVLGKKEGCSGDPARRAGNEFLFQQQAEANIATFNKAQIRKVIASCPHCFHTIKNEYPQLGGQYEVIHHSQLISYLLKEKKLQPMHPLAESVAYHDSCYLGRWNQEYEAPRDVLRTVSKSGDLIELSRNKERGFCCGAGGGRMWQEEKGPRVNRNRTDEILASGAQIAAVACPFCTIMLSDGVKEAGAEEKVQVLDIAEMVRKSLVAIRRKEAVSQPEKPRD